MKTAKQLLDDEAALDLPTVAEEVATAPEAVPEAEEAEAEEQEAPVEASAAEEPTINEPDRTDDPEPSSAPVAVIEDTNEEEGASIAEPTVEATNAPEMLGDEAVESADAPDEPSAPVEAAVEPSAPNESVEAVSRVADEQATQSEPVGFQGDVHHPDATIEQLQSGELDDTPAMDDVDRQVARQVQHEQQRGDDLATKLMEEMRPMFDGMENERRATVNDVVEMEALTISLMRE